MTTIGTPRAPRKAGGTLEMKALRSVRRSERPENPNHDRCSIRQRLSADRGSCRFRIMMVGVATPEGTFAIETDHLGAPRVASNLYVATAWRWCRRRDVNPRPDQGSRKSGPTRLLTGIMKCFRSPQMIAAEAAPTKIPSRSWHLCAFARGAVKLIRG